MNLCRLCGEEKSPLDFNIELNDKTNSNWNYRELIEHHTRVALKTNKLLPQSICEDCRTYIDGFAEFSNKLQTIQNTFDVEDGELEPPTVNECFVQVPIVELFSETTIKEQIESDDNTDVDSDSERDEIRRADTSDGLPRTSTRAEDCLTYEELFSKELSVETISKFDIHLDVPESTKGHLGDVPEIHLSHLNPIRWSRLVRNCEQCDVTFKNLIEFSVHQEASHSSKVMPVTCHFCSYSFRKVYTYMNHLLNKHLHLEHLRYCCLVCDVMFYNLKLLFIHVQDYHYDEARRIFQCLICGHHSENLGLLKRHKRVHDYDEECSEIAKIYAGMEEESLKLNLIVDDAYKKEDGTVSVDCKTRFVKWTDYDIICSLCTTATGLKPIDYYSHHQNEHMEYNVFGKCPAAYRFTCKDCPSETFASLIAFYSHQVYKHCHNELSYRCMVCSKLFWNYVAYSHHLKFFHPSFRHFLCLLCGKMLDRYSLFKHHLVAVHGSDTTSLKRRKREVMIRPKSAERPKRSKIEKQIVKEESDESEEDSESEYDDEISSDDIPLKHKRKERKLRKTNDRKIESTKRRPNNRHRTEKQSLYGPELDTPEKLYAPEISGQSVFTSSLYLNISVNVKLTDGEVSEELASSQGLSSLRWKDLLVCAVCKIKYQNIMGLTEHIMKHHGSRSRAFGCYNCDIEYGALYESSLVNHMVERHYYEHLKFCCLVCSKMFFDLLSLVHHYKVHDGEFEILVCFICGFYAKTLDDLKEHKAYHVQMENSKPENQLLCEKVLERFNKGIEANTFNIDVADYERNPDGTVTLECQRRFSIDWNFAQYQCPLCFVSHSNPFELFVHLRLKHPKEQEHTRKIYSCNTCIEKKNFSGMHYFINHAAEFHYESLRFTCVICTRIFWNYLALATHYRNVHPSFTSVFCCHCGKLFHSITAGAIHYKKIMIMLTDEEKKLKKEGKLETEQSSHICHVCGKACKNNYTLLKHITTHEEPDPSKMLQCHICSKLFNTKNKLNQHMVGHNNLRKWKCKTCGMSFNFKKLLQMHTRAVHENERGFACSFCEKKFFKKYDLTVHVRLHTGDFPYACPVTDCDAKYPAWSNLFKHCQSRHKLDIRSEGYKKLRASEKVSQNDDFESD